MMVSNDFPEVFSFDSEDSVSARTWWDSLGSEWVRVNLVTDTLGNSVGESGSSRDLTGGADRELLNALRAEADVIVIGGATVRAEPDSVPRKKDVVIVSRSGDVPISAIKRARGRVTVLHGRNAFAPPASTGVPLRQFTGDSIIKAVKALGYKRIVCEGGVTLASVFADSSAVDEWCVTVSPRLGSRRAGLVAPEFGGELSNVAHDDEGFRYTRRTRNGAPRKAS